MSVALVVLAGLPGTGKTTIARALAPLSGAVHLRIDTIEAALKARGVSFAGAAGDTGYVVAYALAGDLLRQGRSVIVDAVHGWPGAAELWAAALGDTGAALLRVQLTCSDTAAHRARVETRVNDLPGLTLPSWDEVLARRADPFPDPEIALDTATLTAEASAREILRHFPTH